MVVLRILGALLVIAIGTSTAVYVVTKDRRWLKLSWQIAKLFVIILLIFLALLVLERIGGGI